MELRVLRYFLTVAREENITRAAELLHVSQPAVSRQLAQLFHAGRDSFGIFGTASAGALLSVQWQRRSHQGENRKRHAGYGVAFHAGRAFKI